MLFVSRLPLDAQAQILVSTLAEHGAVLALVRAKRICVGLAGREEKAAAKWLRAELARLRIAVKHNHALRLIGKIAGREGWHGALAETAQFRLMLTGLATPLGWDVVATNPKELLELLCPALVRWASGVTKPRVATLKRNAQDLLISQDVLKDEHGILVLLKAEATEDWEAWFSFQSYAVERIRRVLEESNAPIFLDGAVLSMLPSSKTDGVREITVFDRGIELGRGTELHVLELMEAEAGDELAIGKVSGNGLSTPSHSFLLMETYRKIEPLMETSERTLLHPETEQLMRQYQLFRRKVGAPLSALRLSGSYVAPDGIPQEIRVDWDAVRAAMTTRNATPGSLAQDASSTALGDALLRKPPLVNLTVFVQLARALETLDFNTLVRQPRWSEADAVDEPTLRSVLYAVDDVRFVVGREFAPELESELREACRELHASRRLRQMQQSGALNQPLDELVYAADGEEFLDVAARCEAAVRMRVSPMFIATDGIDLPVKLELPAVGRRLTLLLRPRITEDATGRS
jgi:hypothetical protein